MWNFTAKDKINSRTGVTLEKVKGTKLTVIGYGEFERSDAKETDVTVTVGAIVTTDGIYTTISKTAREAMNDVVDYVTDENLDSCVIEVGSRISNNGREFLTISLVE